MAFELAHKRRLQSETFLTLTLGLPRKDRKDTEWRLRGLTWDRSTLQELQALAPHPCCH